MKFLVGDIYWLHLQDKISHPHVIIEIQDNILTVCALTTNMNKANMPGNVTLDVGEAGLEKQSIVEVSKVSKISTSDLGEYVGVLNEQRITEISAGIRFIRKSFFRT